MRKAQLSIEFFFALTLFALMLVWLNYYAASAKTAVEERQVASQQLFLANDLVSMAEKTCLYNVSADFILPCIVGAEGKQGYTLTTDGNTLGIFMKETGALFEKNSSCYFEQTVIDAECVGENAGAVCLNQSEAGKISFSAKEC